MFFFFSFSFGSIVGIHHGFEKMGNALNLVSYSFLDKLPSNDVLLNKTSYVGNVFIIKLLNPNEISTLHNNLI
jgi:hypothetical protein